MSSETQPDTPKFVPPEDPNYDPEKVYLPEIAENDPTPGLDSSLFPSLGETEEKSKISGDKNRKRNNW